jgi:hypothetical protein
MKEIGFKPHILTKGPYKATRAWSEKYEWCKQNVPNVSVTITEDKGLVYGKVLFDDWPPYIQRWLKWRPRGFVLMLEHPYNSGFEHPQVIRVLRDKSNFDIIKEQLQIAYERQ